MLVDGCFAVSVCDKGFYGADCADECSCANGIRCDPGTGSCLCGLGVRGADCDRPCTPGQYGPGCVHACECQNDAVCDPVTGCCECTPGWYGKNCDMGELSWFTYQANTKHFYTIYTMLHQRRKLHLIFIYLKSGIAKAKHNFKWLKITWIYKLLSLAVGVKL